MFTLLKHNIIRCSLCRQLENTIELLESNAFVLNSMNQIKNVSTGLGTSYP